MERPCTGCRSPTLPGERESNDDPSNYWIFSEAGLMRLIDRAGWDVRAVTGRGNRVDSDPASIRGDERIYCLLSRKTLFTNGRLLNGWYPPDGERSGWRWTQRRFAAEFFVPPHARQSEANQLELDLFVPEAHAPTVVVSAGGTTLADLSPAPGRHRWRFALPAASTERARVEFDVSGRLPTGQDPRPLGVVVGQIHLRTTPLRAS